MNKQYKYLIVKQKNFSYYTIVMSVGDILNLVNTRQLENYDYTLEDEKEFQKLMKDSYRPIISQSIFIGVNHNEIRIIDDSTLELSLDNKATLIDGLKRLLYTRDLKYEYMVNIVVSPFFPSITYRFINRKKFHTTPSIQRFYNTLSPSDDIFQKMLMNIAGNITTKVSEDVLNFQISTQTLTPNEITLNDIYKKILSLISKNGEKDFQDLAVNKRLQNEENSILRELYINGDYKIIESIIVNYLSVLYEDKNIDYIKENILNDLDKIPDVIEEGYKQGNLSVDYFKIKLKESENNE